MLTNFNGSHQYAYINYNNLLMYTDLTSNNWVNRIRLCKDQSYLMKDLVYCNYQR